MPYVEFHRVVLAAVIAMARIGGAFAICPALTESMIPDVARRAFVLGISILAVPPIMAGMPPGEPNHFMFTLVAAKEAFLGFLIGFFAAVPFWVAENVGNLIDNQRGATMGEVYSPLSGAQVSTFGIFFSQIASTLFFVGGAIFVLIGALYSSYSIWPVFTEGITMSNEAPLVILGASDGMLCTTVIISAPVIMVMFLATLGLGFVNRTAPQLNVFFLSMPVKSALGIAFLVIYLPFVMDMLMYGAEDAILAPMKKIIAW
jgi:type III secretion protein T